MQAKDKREDASGSVEVDSFLRDVARAPRLHPPAGASAEPDLVGRTLLHFHVVERLGAGGMGVVYKALDEKLRRPVALKVLSARLLADGRHRETLLREARSAAAVNHPNIAAIHEVHEGPDGAFFVMELVEGETLRARLARTGPLAPAEVLRIGLDIARGLARAHASSVVHRDLKCENVMITRDGHVKLLDFGLATVRGDDEDASSDSPSDDRGAEPRAALGLAPTMPATPTPTTGGRVAGTPTSMSPEQARGEAVDPRIDVYAFGVVLYEMLAGEVPFAHRSGSPWEWGDERAPAWRPRRPLRQLAPRVSRELEQLVTRCLSYAKEKRPADGAALVEEVEARAPRRGRGVVILLSVVIAALCAATIALVVGGARGARAPNAPAPSSVGSVAPSSAAPAAPTLRAVTAESAEAFLQGVSPMSLSDDAERMTYRGRDSKTFRVHNLRTEADEWIRSPDGQAILDAEFEGEGAGERIVVWTQEGSWSIEPDTKRAMKIMDSIWNPPTMPSDGRFFEWFREKDGRDTFGRTDALTGTTRDIVETKDESYSFRLSPDGSTLALVHGWDPPQLTVARPDAPLQGHVVLADPHMKLSFNMSAFDWIDDERLVVSMQEDDADETNLWEIHIDPATLERIGAPVRLTHWHGVSATHLKVHRALRAMSFMRTQSQSDVSVGKLEAGTHRLTNVERLTLAESDERPGAWTKDGQTLVYQSNRSGHWGIYARALTDDTSDRPVVTGDLTSSWPQLVLDDAAILYWSVPKDGPPSLLRAPFGPANAPAEVLFVSPDWDRRVNGAPLPALSRVACAARGTVCVLLSYDSSASAWTWYRLDPSDGSRAPIEGLVNPDPRGPRFEMAPDASRVAVIDKGAVLHVFTLSGTRARETRHIEDVAGLAFDTDGRGMIIGWFQTGTTKPPTVSYLWEDGRRADIAHSSMGALMVAPDGKHLAFHTRPTTYNTWIAEDVFTARR